MRLRRRIVRAVARTHSPTFTSGSLVYIESSDGRVLFVRGRLTGLWTLPGGFHRRNETPEQTAVREVFEETGLEIGGLLKEVDRCRQAHQPHYDHIFIADVDKIHSEVLLRPRHWTARIEIKDREWRTIGLLEDRAGITDITPEAAHALHCIRKIPGRDIV